MRTLYFVTANENKVKEARQILKLPVEHVHLDLDEPQTLDLETIVRQKAIQAHQKTGLPVIVEDTALSFVAWNGLPGTFIKWFLQTVGPVGILKMLSSYEDRRATATTAVAFHDGKQTLVATGQTKGQIALAPCGQQGFGWDAIFIPDQASTTFAEMSIDIKNAFSMRRKALEQLRSLLESHLLTFSA
ncbi:MAG: RdgB/HAM1 family non-canonical purine NTP pyrophosphatase [Acidobacteriota bacterium]|nr:RdgB/HAM1 family non-canonical purine NTP pyrophosphatase [Blastocatellia bacterium]MDW8413113.1 RdgB/HAM1 family non-canonical purine NTP pyrophosphatase [Acidobacteriota bacterium]